MCTITRFPEMKEFKNPSEMWAYENSEAFKKWKTRAIERINENFIEFTYEDIVDILNTSLKD